MGYFASVVPSNRKTEMTAPVSNPRVIEDAVHGRMHFNDYLCTFIDTPEFGRLRDIKQLGFLSWVYASASHSRWEHSLGTAHLVGMLVQGLRTRQPELGITDRDVNCVQLAGLCHDLGHGPYSHVFEHNFMRVARTPEWHHEDSSEVLFKRLVQENEIDMSFEDIEFVTDLILGENRHILNKEKAFLFHIVSNSSNMVDVDKLDYIARDAFQLGTIRGINIPRLIKSCRVVGGELAWSSNDQIEVLKVFKRRWEIHNKYYSDETAMALNHMFGDALLAADGHLGLSSRVDEPGRYVHLTDTILHQIRQSTNEELAASRALLHRMDTHDLYWCVGTWELKTPKQLKEWSVSVTPHTISTTANDISVSPGAHDGTVGPDDIIVSLHKVHCDLKGNNSDEYFNPIDRVSFYKPRRAEGAFRAASKVYASYNPFKYIARIYVRDPRLFSLVKDAGRRITQQQLSALDEQPHGGTNGTSSTAPQSRPRPIKKSTISPPRRVSLRRFSLQRATSVVDNSSSIVTLRGTEKDTPRAVKLFRRYLVPLKEGEVFDAEPPQEEKIADWENITAASGSVHY